jgi:chromosome segregation protein
VKLSLIELQGFRGAKNHLRIVPPPGLLVLTGRNGSGKSTICDAIEYGLTGTLTKYAGGSESGENTDEYLWWRGRAQAFDHFVTLGFKDGDHEFTVTRRPGGVEYSEVATSLEQRLCDLRLITRDPLGQLARTSLIRDESIAELSVDQEEFARFAFVRTALGADGLDEAVQRSKAINASVRKHVDAATDEYRRKRDEVAVLVAELAEARFAVFAQPDVMAAEAATRQLAELVGVDSAQLLPLARQKLAGWRRFSDALLRAAAEVDEVQAVLAAFLTGDMASKVGQLRNTRDASELAIRQNEESLQVQRSALQSTERVETMRVKLASLYEAGGAVGLRDGHCPLCRRPQREEDYRSALSELATEIGNAGVAAANLRARVAQQTLVLERQRLELSGIDAELAALENQRRTALEKLSLVGSQVGEPDANQLTSERLLARVRRGEERIEHLAGAIAVLEASAALEKVADIERRLNEAKRASDVFEQRMQLMERAAARAKGLLNGIRRAVSEVTEERLAALEPLLKDLYVRLKPHAEWTDLGYSVRGDLRKYLSLRVGDDINPRYTFSSGQRRAIGLAFLLAVHLSRPWCHLKSLILDDPVQHIDDFRSLYLVDVLSAIRKTGRQIICAAEDAALAELMCRRISLGQDGGRIVEMSYVPGEGATIARSASILPPKQRVLVD